jgi:hypothetical protein
VKGKQLTGNIRPSRWNGTETKPFGAYDFETDYNLNGIAVPYYLVVHYPHLDVNIRKYRRCNYSMDDDYYLAIGEASSSIGIEVFGFHSTARFSTIYSSTTY